MTSARYSTGAIILHWAIAAALIFEIGLGWRMDLPRSVQSFAVFQLHKSVGITILLLTLLRLAWRLTHRPPAPSGHLATWERRLARATHACFYVLLIGLPLSGWLMVSTSRIVVPTVLYGLVGWPSLPFMSGTSPAARQMLNTMGEIGHSGLVYSAYLLLFLHIAGAMKHHVLDRTDGLARMMMPGPRSHHSVALALVALVAAGALALGNLVYLGPPARAAVAGGPGTAALPASTPTSAVLAERQRQVEAPVVTVAPAIAAGAEIVPQPVKWVVDQANSSLDFRATWSGAVVNGRFGRWKAEILFSPDALARSSVTASIDVSSVTSDSAEAQSALPGEEWLGAATHPTATFVARSFRKLGKDRYRASGTLTIRGVSRLTALDFSLNISGDRARMSGRTVVDRNAFGVGQGTWSATDQVGGSVTVTVALTASKA